jgi:TRAP-type uncharacterized transport system fused permease subunit
VYLSLCVIGALVPYWPFVLWLSVHGIDVRLLLQELFANRISTFFALDVIVSAVVLLVFIGVETARRRIRGWWLPFLATLTVGVSFGLPLLLYMRERDRNTHPSTLDRR